MWTMDPVVEVAFTTPLLQQTLPCEGKRTTKVLALDFLKDKNILPGGLTSQELSLQHESVFTCVSHSSAQGSVHFLQDWG